MKVKNTTITKGFIISGLMNASVLIFSRLFTNSTIPESDPNVMSNFWLINDSYLGISVYFCCKKL